MQFDKPKVTIDLEEYQYLKEHEAKSKNESFYMVARKIIYSVIKYRADYKAMSEYLKGEGISFSYSASSTHADTYEMIRLNFEPPKNNT